MITKLTLTIYKSVIEKAKKYAQGKNKSVSRIVEEYLRNISAGNTTFYIMGYEFRRVRKVDF